MGILVLLRVLYILLKNFTWRKNKAALAVAKHLNLDLGWYRVDNHQAMLFAGLVEPLIERYIGSSPSDESLDRFAAALRTALGENLAQRPLFGIGGLPSCFCCRSNYIRDLNVLSSESIVLHVRKATSSLNADLEIPLIDSDTADSM